MVRQYSRRRYYIKDRFGHRVYVGKEKWPSQEGLARVRRHYKRKHPRAFRESIEKGLKTKRERGLIK